MTSGGTVARSVPSSGTVTEFGKQLQEKSLELLVGAVDIDQKDRRTGPAESMLAAAAARSKRLRCRAPGARWCDSVSRIEDPKLQQLARIAHSYSAWPMLSPS